MSGEKRLVFVDIETGGLDASRHPVIQIAAVAVDCPELVPIETFEVKIQFNEKDCEAGALNVNSYDAGEWAKSAISARDAQASFSQFLSRNATIQMISKAGRPYKLARIAGHNLARFDAPFLQAWYKRGGKFFGAHYSVLCTHQLAMWRFCGPSSDSDGPKDLKLGTLCEYFGIDIGKAHDALADVRANVNLCRKLLYG